jgi:hypothetical protein
MNAHNYTPIPNNGLKYMVISSTITQSCPIDMPFKTETTSASTSSSSSLIMSNLDNDYVMSGPFHSIKSTNTRISLDAGYESLLSTSSSNSSGLYLNSFGHNSTSNGGVLGLLNSAKSSIAHNHHYQQHISSSASSVSGSSTNGHTSDAIYSSDDSNGCALFSQPSTPVKSLSQSSHVYHGCNLARTPDHKHELVADVGSYYFASIRASANKTLNETTTKQSSATSNFSHYSASNSNSPIKFNYNYATSPKFVPPNPDNYVTHRDGLSSKLLRSPAFKIANSPASTSKSRFNFPPNFTETTAPPVIKSFSSRFEAFNQTINSPITQTPVTPTPTEEEFMELLFKNKHLPMNPEFLIGRHMGIEQMDIIAELNKRSMQNVIDKIFSNLLTSEPLSMVNVVRASSVNKEWRDLIKQNKRLNKRRVEFLKESKRLYDKYKENRKDKNESVKPMLVRGSSLSWADKKNIYKNQIRAGASLNEASANATLNESESSCLVAPFMLIDMNCMNQINDSFYLNNNSSSSLWKNSFSSSMKLGSFNKGTSIDSQMVIDEDDAIDEVISKDNSEMSQFKTSLTSEIGKVNSSILSSIGNMSESQLDISKYRVSQFYLKKITLLIFQSINDFW